MALFLAKRSRTRPTSLVSPILQLPSVTRAFHASPHPQLIGDLVSYTQIGLEALHSTTCLPWAYTIPLAALVVRLTIVLPMRIRSRRTIQRREDMSPLILAWLHQLRKDTVREAPHVGPIKAQKMLLKKFTLKSRDIYKRNKCQIWRIYLPSLTQLPIWLVISEALRRMCGTREGILGLFKSASTGSEGAANAGVEAGMDKHVSLEDTSSNELAEIAQSGIVESLDHEGALWFTNLLLPDLYCYLSAILSAVFIISIMSKRLLAVQNIPFWQVRIQRGLILVGVAVFPLTLNVPAAMMVYWISSFSMGIAMDKVLDLWRPIKRARLPSKRKTANKTL